jgi:hypothetical protein
MNLSRINPADKKVICKLSTESGSHVQIMGSLFRRSENENSINSKIPFDFFAYAYQQDT